jgi:hypothetical protein
MGTEFESNVNLRRGLGRGVPNSRSPSRFFCCRCDSSGGSVPEIELEEFLLGYDDENIFCSKNLRTATTLVPRETKPVYRQC